MAVKIKLKRMGKIREAYYRIVVADARTKRDGRAIEEIGKYHPKSDPSFIEVNSERAQHWLSVGAQPTDPVRKLLEVTGDWQRFKGLPGAEGTLKMAAPRTDKKDVFAAALAETHAETPAAPKGRGRAGTKSAEATPGDAKDAGAKAGDAKGAEAKTREAKAREPKAREPKAREPKAREPKAREPKAGEAKADEDKGEKPEKRARSARSGGAKGETAKNESAKGESAKGDSAKASGSAKSKAAASGEPESAAADAGAAESGSGD